MVVVVCLFGWSYVSVWRSELFRRIETRETEMEGLDLRDSNRHTHRARNATEEGGHIHEQQQLH